MSQPQTKSTLASASSTKRDPHENSIWTDDRKPFHCCAEFHLQDMSSRFTAPLYSWGRRLSVNSECFFPSIGTIAKFFNRDRTTVLRAIQDLARSGWAEVVQKEPGKPVAYRFIDHDDWAEKYPGHCVEKDDMPWEGEGDLLGRALYAASGGQARFLPHQMDGLRKSGFSDQQIASEFRIFLDRRPQRGRDWKRVYFPFRACLFRIAADLNSCNGESLGSDTHQSRKSDTTSRSGATGTSRAGATQVVEVEL